jgi:hypothetical protein
MALANTQTRKHANTQTRRRRKSLRDSRLCFDRLENRQLLASVAPVVVADYQDDFQGTSFPQDWEYLWNAPVGWNSNGQTGAVQTGLITDGPATFDALHWNGVAWTPDGDANYTNNAPAGFLRLESDGGHPGNPDVPSGGEERFAIAAFQIQDSGFYAIEDSLLGIATNASMTDGVEYRVFVNDQAPVGSGIATTNNVAGQSAYAYFDTDLGFLAGGDTVYVAVGSNGSHNFDTFELDYSIVRHEGRELTAETFSSTGSLSGGWQYTVENSGLYGIQGSDVTAGNVDVSIAVDNNNGIANDDTLFYVPGLSGTDFNPDNDSFDRSLGYLRKGDTVSISGNAGNVSEDFSIVRVVPREAPDVTFADSVDLANVFDVDLPSNTIDAFPVLNQAIGDALARVATLRAAGSTATVEVRLEPGTYHLNSANGNQGPFARHFFVLGGNVSNFVINGNGSTIVTSDDSRGLFKLQGSEDVIIKDLSVDYAELTRYSDGGEIVDVYKPVTFTQGTIAEVESGSILLDIDTTEFFAPDSTDQNGDERFVPTNGQDQGGFWGFAVDPSGTGRLATNTRSSIYTTVSATSVGVSPEDNGDGTLQRFEVFIGNGLQGLQPGDGYVMQRRKGPAIFDLLETDRVSLQRVTAWSAPSLFMISRQSSLNNVLDSHVGIRPDTGRWSSINADAVHVQSDLTGVWVEDSSFYGVSDDVMNFYSTPSTVHENIGGPDNELVIGEFSINNPTNFSRDDLHQPGDILAFVNPQTGLVIGKAKVVGAVYEPNYLGPFRPAFRITLDQPVSGIVEGTPGSSSTNNPFVEGYGNDTLVFNISINQGFVVQDSVLADSRRYGNFVMASNVNLVDNIYQGLPEQAIAGHSELAWPLGAHPRNVLVQGNQFRDIGFSIDYLDDPYHQGAVSFFMDRAIESNGTEERAFVHQYADEITDIQIRDNVFEQWSKRAMVVRNANRVTIEDNDILGTNLEVSGLGNPTNNLVFELDYNREIAIQNNRVVQPPAFQTDPPYAVGQNIFAGIPEPLEAGAANNLMLEPARVVSINRGVRDESRMDLLTSFSITFDRAVSFAEATVEAMLQNALTIDGVALNPLTFDYDAARRTATWSNFLTGGAQLDPGNYEINIDTSSVGVASPLPVDLYLAIPGDVNLDQTVDVLGDAFAVVGNLGATATGSVVETTWRMGDLNGDNAIDVLGDAFVLVANLGQSV